MGKHFTTVARDFLHDRMGGKYTRGDIGAMAIGWADWLRYRLNKMPMWRRYIIPFVGYIFRKPRRGGLRMGGKMIIRSGAVLRMKKARCLYDWKARATILTKRECKEMCLWFDTNNHYCKQYDYMDVFNMTFAIGFGMRYCLVALTQSITIHGLCKIWSAESRVVARNPRTGEVSGMMQRVSFRIVGGGKLLR